MNINFKIYRYNPEKDKKPYMQNIKINLYKEDKMLLDALQRIIYKIDNSLSIRKSCREGVCGSDAINVNGKNCLACITNIKKLKKPIIIKPLPGFKVIKDLIVDLSPFYKKYHLIKPYLINNLKFKKEILQTPEKRKKINGYYECILCACCTSSCPSFWWNSKTFIGPAGLLQAYRFISDSRDTEFLKRLKQLNNFFYLFRCKSIMNCVNSCPKNLNPNIAIENIKTLILRYNV